MSEPSGTVLVIDDDRLVRWTMSTILERAGYRVHEAGTGAEGLSLIPRIAPDVVLLDIVLPEMDGFTILERIRQAHPDLPVLMMSSHQTAETIDRAMRLGALASLGKPCDAKSLLAAVARALRPSTPPNEGADRSPRNTDNDAR